MTSVTQSSARKKSKVTKNCVSPAVLEALLKMAENLTRFAKKKKLNYYLKTWQKNSKIQVYSWKLLSEEMSAKPLQSCLINIGSDFKQHGNYLQAFYKRLNCSHSPIFPQDRQDWRLLLDFALRATILDERQIYLVGGARFGRRREKSRLRVVPHFSSGIVERAKRERAWKSPHANLVPRAFPLKNGWGGKGPGIGWSRVPSYTLKSWV